MSPSTNERFTLYFKWARCKTDGTPYKVYSPELEPLDVQIAVEIPASEVLNETNSATIITPLGMALAMRQLATAISRVYGE